MASCKEKAGPPVRIDLKKERHREGDRGPRQGQDGPRAATWIARPGRVLVEHVNMIKRHTRPNPAKQIKGGIAERESPIAASNVMIVCPGCNKAGAHQASYRPRGGRQNRGARGSAASADRPLDKK